MKTKRGFTLLELIVVVIIIGVLATLGLMQYREVIERGRRAEARSNLGTLRTLQVARQQEGLAFGNLTTLIGSGLPGACDAANTDYYFQYSCDGGTGTCTAARCTTADAGGRDQVDPAAGYSITLTTAGAWGGSI